MWIRLMYNLGIRALHLAESLAALWHHGASGRVKMRSAPVEPLSNPAWFHCASLGEYEQIQPVIRQFSENHPDVPILLSFYSPSGFFAPVSFPHVHAVVPFPADLPEKVSVFLETHRPRFAVFVKSEIWLNMLEALHKQKIPVALVAARWGKSAFLEKKWALPWRKALSRMQFISTQNSETAEQIHRFIPELQHVFSDGDPRTERVLDITESTWDGPEIPFPKEQIAAAGSIWPADFPLISRLLQENQDIRWILAPHAMHADYIRKLCTIRPGKTIRWSEIKSPADFDGKTVLILDVIGKLSMTYRFASMAYVGGGFGKQVHNILEPAAYGIPVFFGPRHQRSREALEFVQMGTGFSNTDQEILAKKFMDVWNSPEQKIQIQKNLKNWFKNQRGCAKRIEERLSEMLSFK